MAGNKRIDQLTSNGNAVKGSDIVPIFSDGRTERTTIDEISTYLGITELKKLVVSPE